jgi:hypothetical protein
LRRVLADFGGVYFVNGPGSFAASGPVAIIPAVGTRGAHALDLSSWIRRFS